MMKYIFSRKFFVHLLIAFGLVVVSIAGAYYFLQDYTRQDESQELIDLNGFDIVEAEVILKDLHLDPMVVDSLYLPEVRGGQVVDQEPIAGSMVKTDRKIYLTIARYSSPMVKLPNIIDQTLPLAMAKLSSYDIGIGELSYKPSDCTNCVIGVEIDNTPLEIGANLSKGQIVDLVIGEGESGETVMIPALTGLSIDEARMLLNKSGLNIGATPCPDCETHQDSIAARIYRQVPGFGSNQRISLGTSIDIYLTINQEKIPSINLDSLKALLK